MKHFEYYLKHLKASCYAKGSIVNYFIELRKLKQYFKALGISNENDITENQISQFIKDLKERSISDACYLRVLMYTKSYFNFLEENNYIFISPMREVELPKEKKNHYKILSKKEVIENLEKLNDDSKNAIKARSILELLYSSALRPGEIANIKLTDIDFKSKTLFVSMAKNKKDRVVPVGEKAIYWINKYRNEVRSKITDCKSNNYLFLSNFKNKCRRMTFYAMKKFLASTFNKYGIKPFTIFSLRPSAATHMLQNGMDILYLKELLGHEELKTTKIYLRVSLLDLINEFNLKHPRFNKNIKQGELK